MAMAQATQPAVAPANVTVEQVRQFVRTQYNGPVPYVPPLQLNNDAAVRQLRAMLKDPREAAYWGNASTVLGYLGSAADAEALKDYFVRRDDWDKIPGAGGVRLREKIDSLKWIGKLDPAGSSAMLQSALNEEGAAKLAAAWIDLPEFSTDRFKMPRTRILSFIRGAAAAGLVYSRIPENIELVQKLSAQVIAINPDATQGVVRQQLNAALRMDQQIRDAGSIDAYLRQSVRGDSPATRNPTTARN